MLGFAFKFGRRLREKLVRFDKTEISHDLVSNFVESQLCVEQQVSFHPTRVLRIRNARMLEPSPPLNLPFELNSEGRLAEGESQKDSTRFTMLLVPELEAPIYAMDGIQSTIVTENLFQALKVFGVSGKDFQRDMATNGELFPHVTRSNPSSDRRGGRMERDQWVKSRAGSLWDLLYTLLLPPVDLNFGPQFELFGTLFGFQPAGIEFLIRNTSALLADEMGTGKTVMSVVALKLLFRTGRARKVLIVCPVSLLRTWQDHLCDWANELHLTVVRGTPAERLADWNRPSHVYLTAYDTVASDFRGAIKKDANFSCPHCQARLRVGRRFSPEDDDIPTFSCPHCKTILNDHLIANLPRTKSRVDPSVTATFDVLLIDEAQYIKSPSSNRSRSIRMFAPSFRWALTGTPIENSLEDLVAIFRFVKPGLFSTERFLTPKRAMELIEPHFLRRLKKDVMKDLPPKIVQEIWLDLDPIQRKAYDSAEREGIVKLENIDVVTKIHVFALITRLKQICNFGPGQVQSSKTRELQDLVSEIKANGQKVLVFSQYDVEGITKLAQILRPFGVSVLKGGLSDTARELAIQNFRQDPSICVFLAGIRTGGVGLTLTEASYVIHFDHWWNPALMWQANDRVHRSGQKSSQVNIYSFWMQDTIEERIHKILKNKALIFDEIVNGLSVSDIEEMITIDEWLGILGVKPKSQSRNSPSSQESNRRPQATRSSERKQEGPSPLSHESTEAEQRWTWHENTSPLRSALQRENPEILRAHEILKIEFGSTSAEIATSYRRLAKLYHPDKAAMQSHSLRLEFEEIMKTLNWAYELLKTNKYV